MRWSPLLIFSPHYPHYPLSSIPSHYTPLALTTYILNILHCKLLIILIIFTDPLVMDFPLLSKPLHFYRDQSEAPEWLRVAGKKILDADAYLVVSAEYNHAIPPALSNMMDHFACSSYSFKPSGIVCYSPSK